MTWHYELSTDNSSIDVWDHTGTKVASGRTVSGSGIPDSRGNTFPDDLVKVARSEIRTAIKNGNYDYAQEAILDICTWDVTKGAPA